MAYAYFDPGNGGYLWAALWGYLLSVITFVLTVAGAFYRNFIVAVVNRHKIPVLLLIGFMLLGVTFGVWRKYNQKQIGKKVSINKVFKPGVFFYDPLQSYKGYNYLEGNLYDMTGKLVHSWRKSGFVGSYGIIDVNGDLYASSKFEEGKWGRYDWNGNVIWEKDFIIHHDIVLDGDRVIVFTKEKREYKGRQVAFDVIVTLDKNGNEIYRWHLWDAKELLRKYHDPVLLDIPFVPIRRPEVTEKPFMDWAPYDYFHLNSLQIIPANTRENDDPAFKQGNWLISFRDLNLIAILDKNSKQVLWSLKSGDLSGRLDSQHGPLLLANGNILLFDNGSKRKWSRVIEIDPVSRNIVWEYKNKGFFSRIMGYAQPLPNGNILITESENWRMFEVTREKTKVWEFFNRTPYRKSTMRESYRMIRYSPEHIEPLLKKYAQAQ